MNIFFLDEDPKLAAQYHCNKHVIKMILEGLQVLSTVNHLKDNPISGIYRPTHIHHPCIKWAAESKDNYLWLYNLTHHLLFEYTYRYEKIHKGQGILPLLFPNKLNFINSVLTAPSLCMPDKYKCDNPVKAYRDYYCGEKYYFAKWTNRPIPHWFIIN